MIYRILKSVLLSSAILVSLSSQTIAAEGYKGPDDEETVRAAQKSLQALNSEKGAIPFAGEKVSIQKATIVRIIGFETVSYSGSSTDINKALEEFGAKEMDMGIQISLSGDILFDFDKWEIKEQAIDTLTRLAKLIKDLKKHRVLIEGHTDSKGSEPYNLDLSNKRALSVKEWLISVGTLSDIEFQVEGHGESSPIAPNTNLDGSDNPDGRAANRRVEIIIRD
jgi:outer membrane protein OmpA-like peptidoglycan-associated protein